MFLKNLGVLAILLLLSLSVSAQRPSYQYFRIGLKSDSDAKAITGYALMGGGKDLDDAFRWLCEKGNGGDFLVLRAADDDAYNPYVNGLCRANSVATLVIPDRTAANNPAVANIIGHAEALFIAGGDQAHYIRAWQNTPVQQALNAHIAVGKPIGGTSAGLAVLGEFAYSALNDPPDGMLASPEALKDPFTPQVALRRNFLKIPVLHDTITDSHFAKRDRLGRSLVFLARLMQDGWTNSPREIAVDESSAVLIDGVAKPQWWAPGKARTSLKPSQLAQTCKKNVPLRFSQSPPTKLPPARISIFHHGKETAEESTH